MMRFSIICLLAFLLGMQRSAAQYVVTIPADAKRITSDSIIVLTPGPGSNQSFLVCQGRKLTLQGISTYIIRAYLEENAVLNFDSASFSLYLMGDYFMKTSSKLDYNKHMGSFMDTLMIQNPVSVVDTQNVIPASTLPCTTLTFDYSLLPGGISGCAALSTTKLNDRDPQIIIPSPVSGNILFESPYEGSFMLSDANGRLVRTQAIHAGGMSSILLEGIESGMYYYRITDHSRYLQQGKLIVR